MRAAPGLDPGSGISVLPDMAEHRIADARVPLHDRKLFLGQLATATAATAQMTPTHLPEHPCFIDQAQLPGQALKG